MCSFGDSVAEFTPTSSHLRPSARFCTGFSHLRPHHFGVWNSNGLNEATLLGLNVPPEFAW